jgi:hypothetical protein
MPEVHSDERAIIVGASMGGVLGARAPADYCGEVAAVERELPNVYEPGRALLTDDMRRACLLGDDPGR